MLDEEIELEFYITFTDLHWFNTERMHPQLIKWYVLRDLNLIASFILNPSILAT